MKTRHFLLVLIFTLLAQTGPALGSPPDASPAGETKQMAESRVSELQRQLAEARKKVSRIETELSTAQRKLAQLVKTPNGAGEQRSPLAVTRLTGSDLERGGVQDITRVAPLVPGMQFGHSGNEARIAIRGTRTTRTGPEAEPVVGVYQDGVEVLTTTQALGPYIDTRQIDVLRGPQGVMYGRNAFGGVINIISNRPDPSGWDTALQGTIGFSDHTRFEAMLNIPVLDTLAVRVAGSSESYSGYVNNYVLESDADDLKTRIQQYLRVMTRWQPTDDFSLQLNFTSLDQNGTGSGMWGYMQNGAYIDGEYRPGHHFAPIGATPDYGPWDIARNMASLTELENLSTSLLLNWNLGFATLEWQTNKTRFENMQVFDGDYSNGGSNFDSDFNGWNSFADTLSSDLRLKSEGNGRFDWLAGLHVLSSETDWGWLETRDSVQLQPQWDSTGLYTTDSRAAYVRAGFQATKQVRLFGGVRWYEDEKQLRNGTAGSWDGALWNTGIEHEADTGTLSYFSISTGYRPGGLNEITGVPPRYDSEHVTAYEVGLKRLFANDTVSLNLSAFFNEYRDMQAQSFALPSLTGTAGPLDYLSTAGDMESRGVEAEFKWLPGSHWSISGYLSWLDAEFDNYRVDDLAGLGNIVGHTSAHGLELDGWRPAFSPEWSLGLHASYRIDAGRWGSITPMLQTTFTSEFFANDLNLPGALQTSQTITDLRVFWDFPGKGVRVQLYIENASDEHSLKNTMIYNPAERPEIATFLNDWGDPRKYGLILSYRYR